MTVRELEPERDAAAIVDLIREISPIATINSASWLHQERVTPERAAQRTWVADVAGRAVGRVAVGRSWFGGENVSLQLAVTTAQRRRGIGATLYELGLEYARSLEPREVTGEFFENDAGLAFAQSRGFRVARTEQAAVVDPRTVAEEPRTEVRPLTEIDPRIAHRIDETATRDMPAVEPIEAIPYEEWEQLVLRHPLIELAGSFAAFADGEPAAVSLLIADAESGRATTMFTGTLPDFRGRGLGLAAKVASVRWAAEHGITSMATTNDATNAPMLAINRRLGYRPVGRRIECVLSM
jgi:GNAT superfamily N-acetyltransferase